MSHENYSRVEASAGSSDRTFGLVFAVLFFCIALIPLLAGASPRYWSAAVSVVLLIVSMLKPSFFAWPNKVWTLFGALLHKIVNPLVLAVIFFLIISPYAVVMRSFRKDQLGLVNDPVVDSYWQKRTIKVPNMKYQF